MPNSINKQFKFGFLNNAQDPTDIANTESQDTVGCDPDALALGTIQPATSIPSPTPVPDPMDEALLNGRSFQLNSGVLEYKPKESTSPYYEVNAFDETQAGEYSPSNQKNRDDSRPPKGYKPVISGENRFFADITPGDIITADGTSDELQVGFADVVTQAVAVRTYVISVTNAAAPWNWKMRYGTDDPTAVRQSGLVGAGEVFLTLEAGIFIWFPLVGSTAQPDEWDPVLNDEGQFTVTLVSLPDGTYTYMASAVDNASNLIEPLQDIQSLPSDPTVFTLQNRDEAGVLVSNVLPVIAFPFSDFAGPTGVNEVWLFRKETAESEFIRVHVFPSNPGDPDYGIDFVDSVQAGNLTNLTLLASEDDEGFPKLNAAIGNDVETFGMLFEKDNRLWMQPTDRKDLLLFSRTIDWWGWNRTNAFAFDGDVVDITHTRDPTVVGGEFTMVVFTTNGIFHITGNGTEGAPYKLFPAVRDINVAKNSVVDMNGIIMLTTVSSNGEYDDGAFGQKVYEYDLQKLIEVSGRVKTSPFITTVAAIEYAIMLGGDKYLAKKVGVDYGVLYHRDVQGWMHISPTVQAADQYFWTSKDFTPEFFDRFKIAGARKFKMAFTGQVRLVFHIRGPDDNLGGNQETITLTFGDVGVTSRKEIINRLPSVKGRIWNFNVLALTANSAIHDFYFVI